MSLRIQRVIRLGFLPLKKIPSRGKEEIYAQIAKVNSIKCYKSVITEGHRERRLEEELGFLPFRRITTSFNQVRALFS